LTAFRQYILESARAGTARKATGRESAMDAPAKKSNLIKGATGDWEVVIGMEVHAQVTSQAKLFSGASTAFGGEPNSHVSLVDAAMPGMLPVINAECVRQAVRTGLGLKAKINLKSVFDRKNYFYPDLPQGYQISQYKSPIVGEGEVVVDMPDGETVRIGIERLHLEQDAGKSLHDQNPSMSLVDLNRAGVALMEIVSKPDLRSAEEAKAFMTEMRAILRDLGTCDGDMEKGNLRADVNVSVRRPGEPLSTRCEIKNLNSINFIGQAIDYEARRQIDTLEDGGIIRQETRLFDPDKGETRSMRTKEEAHDYRYFPDPDLLPLEISASLVDDLRKDLLGLRKDKKARFISDHGLSAYDSDVLVAERERAEYYEEIVKGGAEPKAAANWLINEYLGRLNRHSEQRHGMPTVNQTAATHSETLNTTSEGGQRPGMPNIEARIFSGTVGHLPLNHLPPVTHTSILSMVSSGLISSKTGKDVLDHMMLHPDADPREWVEKHNLQQVTDLSALEKIVDDIVAKHADKVADAKANPKAIGWFVGQVMKASGGKANPQAVNDLLKKKIGI
jgi:aspartyl-tRNA(Asn)/glutamyl-tRNA(Gln) amidotransferase subunit B